MAIYDGVGWPPSRFVLGRHGLFSATCFGETQTDPRSCDRGGLTRLRATLHGGRVSLLLPQSRAGTVRSATPVSIHGDRYVDLAIALDGDAGPPVVGRVGATDCSESLTPGERVSVRFTMGVMVRVAREGR